MRGNETILRRCARAHSKEIYLVPKLGLGTHLSSKLQLRHRIYQASHRVLSGVPDLPAWEHARSGNFIAGNGLLWSHPRPKNPPES